MSLAPQWSKSYSTAQLTSWDSFLKLSDVGLPISWFTPVSCTAAGLSGKEFITRMLGDSHNGLLGLENQAWKLHSQEPYSKSCHRAVQWKEWVPDIGSRATVPGHWLLLTAGFYVCSWRLWREAGKACLVFIQQIFIEHLLWARHSSRC